MPSDPTILDLAVTVADVHTGLNQVITNLVALENQLATDEATLTERLHAVQDQRRECTALLAGVQQLVAGTESPAPTPHPPLPVEAKAASDPAGTDGRPLRTSPREAREEAAAACARAAHAAGEPMTVALVDAGFAGTTASAQQLISVLRKRGHDIPDARAGRKPGPTLDQVADTYKQAYIAGRKPITVLVDQFGITRADAGLLVAKARVKGLLPPRDEPPVPATDIPQQFVPRG